MIVADIVRSVTPIWTYRCYRIKKKAIAGMKGISSQPGSMVRSRGPIVSDASTSCHNAIQLSIGQLLHARKEIRKLAE